MAKLPYFLFEAGIDKLPQEMTDQELKDYIWECEDRYDSPEEADCFLQAIYVMEQEQNRRYRARKEQERQYEQWLREEARQRQQAAERAFWEEQAGLLEQESPEQKRQDELYFRWNKK